MLPATPKPPPIFTAPVVLEVEAVVSEKVGAPVKVPDTAPELIEELNQLGIQTPSK